MLPLSLSRCEKTRSIFLKPITRAIPNKKDIYDRGKSFNLLVIFDVKLHTFPMARNPRSKNMSTPIIEKHIPIPERNTPISLKGY